MLGIVISTLAVLIQYKFPLLPRHIRTAPKADTSLSAKLFDIRLALLRPLQHEVASEQVRMFERVVCVLCLVPRDELKESKAARATIKALR